MDFHIIEHFSHLLHVKVEFNNAFRFFISIVDPVKKAAANRKHQKNISQILRNCTKICWSRENNKIRNRILRFYGRNRNTRFRLHEKHSLHFTFVSMKNSISEIHRVARQCHCSSNYLPLHPQNSVQAIPSLIGCKPVFGCLFRCNFLFALSNCETFAVVLESFRKLCEHEFTLSTCSIFFCSDCTHKLLHISCIWKIEPIKCLCTWNKASLKFTPGTLKMKLEIYRRSSSEKTKKRHTKHSTPWTWRAGTFCREQKMKWPS